MALPPEEVDALNEVAKELKLGDPRIPSREVMRRLQAFFSEKFTNSTWQEIPRGPRTNNLTALGRFLLQNRTGHCEYFATATTLLLRRARIPARYAVGYYVHERSGSKYVVRLRDAHAWCLVCDVELQQLVNFDTTPSSWILEES